MARHHRQRGEDVFFLTGTDEHGEPVADARTRAGDRAAGAGRPQRRALQGADAAARGSNDFFIRTTDPEHMAKVQEVLRACTTTGTSTRAPTRAGTARAARTSRRERDRRGQPLPDPPHRADARAGGELLLQAVAFQEPLERLYAERAGLRDARARATTRRSRSSARGCATSALARTSSPGACRCRGIPSTSSTCGSTRC
jgi:methionyl-tRNA synthetase